MNEGRKEEGEGKADTYGREVITYLFHIPARNESLSSDGTVKTAVGARFQQVPVVRESALGLVSGSESRSPNGNMSKRRERAEHPNKTLHLVKFSVRFSRSRSSIPA